MLLMESMGCTSSIAFSSTSSFFFFFLTFVFAALALILSDRRPGCEEVWIQLIKCKIVQRVTGVRYFDNSWHTRVPLVWWWGQAPEVSHSLQAATTLATSSAEPPTFLDTIYKNVHRILRPGCWWWRRPSARPGRRGWRQWGGRCGWSGRTLRRSERSHQSCPPPRGCSPPSGRRQQIP